MDRLIDSGCLLAALFLFATNPQESRKSSVLDPIKMKFFNDKYSGDIRGKARSFQIPNMGWEDVAQELDIALWRALSKFQGRNNASERTFALTVMRNRLFDLAKVTNRQKRILDSYHLVFSELQETERGCIRLERARSVLGAGEEDE